MLDLKKKVGKEIKLGKIKPNLERWKEVMGPLSFGNWKTILKEYL
jgi:hypothetical protein